MQPKRDPISEAQERLNAIMRAHRREEVDAALDGDVGAHHLARESVSSVFPQLPGMIDARVGEVSARIYSREDLRAMLADFAVEMLLAQMQTQMRWLRAKTKIEADARRAANRRG